MNRLKPKFNQLNKYKENSMPFIIQPSQSNLSATYRHFRRPEKSLFEFPTKLFATVPLYREYTDIFQR